MSEPVKIFLGDLPGETVDRNAVLMSGDPTSGTSDVLYRALLTFLHVSTVLQRL